MPEVSELMKLYRGDAPVRFHQHLATAMLPDGGSVDIALSLDGRYLRASAGERTIDADLAELMQAMIAKLGEPSNAQE
jgi:hypothetical protein